MKVELRCSGGLVKRRTDNQWTHLCLPCPKQSSNQGGFVQVLAYSVACVSVSSFCGGLTDASKAEEAMKTLQALTEESQQVCALQFELLEQKYGGFLV